MATEIASPPTRHTILDAADRLLARYGYRKTSMEDLAREAGLSRRTLYLHFESKEELFLSKIARVVERLVAELERIAVAPEPVEKRLARMLRTRVLHRFDSVQGYFQSLDEMFSALRPAYLERRERWFELEAKVFAKVLAEGSKSGAFLAGDTALARERARTLLIATNALLPYSLRAEELGSRREVEREIVHLSEMLIHGLVRPDGAAARSEEKRP